MYTTTTTTATPAGRRAIVDNYKTMYGTNFIKSFISNGNLVIDYKLANDHYVRRTFLNDDGSVTISIHYRYWNETNDQPYGEFHP
jgi:hypothetical protein